MTNIFEDKIVKYLTLGLALAIAGMSFQSLFSARQSLPDSQTIVEALPTTLPKVPSVILDPKNLDNLKVESLKPFIESLKPFEVVNFPTSIGRVNPFEPYPLVEPTSTNATTSNSGYSTSSVPFLGPTTTPATTTATSATTSGI